MKKITVIAIGFLLCNLANAEVYRCVIDGKVSFSDKACPGEGKSIDVKVSPPSGSGSDAEMQVIQNDRDRIQSNEKVRQRLDNRVKIRQLDEDIDSAQIKLRMLSSQMESELQALKNKKRSANNNLAGAVYEQSISSEMNAVAGSYNNKIIIQKNEIDRLQREKQSLMSN
ncbi:DUF4124 domain-containing protein [Undibacterium sp. FT147W]|uniref:DUF4124 domain-containing protein n=1 Tax=Undibacterium rivi TaxID=2828729 RepID=A0ABS5H5V3_9BURK|nr:DUF4124 domain-containing protein [Undibacterium rivi]MBR7793799.1 DUF4124 domain-containing protein [Undibacterium rivi]